MSDTLVDAMAKAICIARGGDPEFLLAINDSYDDGRPEADVACPAWMNHRQAARAALAAIEAEGWVLQRK